MVLASAVIALLGCSSGSGPAARLSTTFKVRGVRGWLTRCAP